MIDSAIIANSGRLSESVSESVSPDNIIIILLQGMALGWSSASHQSTIIILLFYYYLFTTTKK